MITDGYAHCGISKYLPAPDLLSVMIHSGVSRAMLSQHLGEYDNSYLCHTVRQYPERFIATCLVKPSGAAGIRELRRWYNTDCFRGLRVLSSQLEKHLELCAAALGLGMNVVLYAPEGIARALETVRQLARGTCRGHVVISHLGNPKVDEQHLVYGSEVLELAAEPNVYVQLSGLSMFCPFPYRPLHGLTREVIAGFGADRVLWGSNYPVGGSDVASYRRDLSFVRSRELNLKDSEIEQITSGTAARLWFVDR